MKQTNTDDPAYFHKVVNCQWACPAHTPVPAYIRQIAQGRYADAYLLNRASNVFPGVLGRVCDRPCEPACRRGRVDEEPVAICRLKRVAADHKGDVADRIPGRPEIMNGKKIAIIGAGPASFTVANDLAPMGYDCTIFEKLEAAGGLMRSNIPAFRLPDDVLDEELGYILNMGVTLKLGTPIESMKALLAQGYDAVFVGSGAPKGRDLNLEGRGDVTGNIHIGINWLEEVAFEHTTEIGKTVLIIGVGNTAMDCCRTSLRLGANTVKVMARKPRAFFKASVWELEDAEEENIEILVNHSPKAFVSDNGKLIGMVFEKIEYTIDDHGKITDQKSLGDITIPCDDVIVAIGQENAFPWIEKDSGIELDQWSIPKVDPVTFMSNKDGVFFGGDAAFGPKNIIWAVEHGHQAAISIDKYCHGQDIKDRTIDSVELASTKMGLYEWSFSNAFDASDRRQMQHVDMVKRFAKLDIEVELGYSPEQIATEVERCLNCDIQTVFTETLCEECDACVDICPVECLSMIPIEMDEAAVRGKMNAPDPEHEVFASGALPLTGRMMIKDENLCLHCGLCAERCPTAAWDMQESIINITHARDVNAGNNGHDNDKFIAAE